MIKLVFLMMFSFSVLAVDQLTWNKAELREDGSQIEEIEKYILYHWYENILQPSIEIDGAYIVYSDPDRRIGIHVYEISTVEAGKEGKKGTPFAYFVKSNATPQQITISGDNLIIQIIE